MSEEFYIGLMSGTSIDALDGVLCAFDSSDSMRTLASASAAWEDGLRRELHSLCSPGSDEINRLGRARAAFATHSAALVKELLKQAGLESSQIAAIGSHGQTIRHHPALGFSLQLDDGPRLAALSGIDAVTDFRSADVALGGEGAPLTPAFHRRLFAKAGELRFVLNLGGIANLTALQGEKITLGFDTGPANTLLDLCTRELFGLPFDEDARLALQGNIDAKWLDILLGHPYFAKQPPKSTGREDFDAATIATMLECCRHDCTRACSLLRTLIEVTVRPACQAILRTAAAAPDLPARLIICGGGVYNPLIFQRFREELEPHGIPCQSSADFGAEPRLIEAEAFAWMAMLCTHGKYLDLRELSGSSAPYIPGSLSPAAEGYYFRRCRGAGPAMAF